MLALNSHPAPDGFRRMTGLLDLLLLFAGLSVFAEGLYRPLKRLGAGLYLREPGVWAPFQDAVVPVLPAIFLLIALWQSRRLFAHLATGETLSADTTRGVRRSGEWIVAAAVTAVIIGEAGSGLQPGWALPIVLAAIGLALRSLAPVFDHAAAVKADHDQIV